jgi:hypothetical protein
MSKDLVVVGHQHITQEWWEKRQPLYDLYVSLIVLDEAKAGDPEAAKKRLQSITDVPVLELTPEALALAKSFIEPGAIPKKAEEDALHIAVATVNGMDFLLTWNCKHIANAEIQKRIRTISQDHGYEAPMICTPEELMGV